MTCALAVGDTHRAECCWLLAPLAWPATRSVPRRLHRMLALLADLLDAVAAAHRLATELAVRTGPPGQGWRTALAAIDAAAVDTTDTGWLTRQLTDHGMHAATELLRRGLGHRLQALQLLRRAGRTDRIAPLDLRQIAGLLAAVTYHLEQAGQSLAAADQTVITTTLETHP